MNTDPKTSLLYHIYHFSFSTLSKSAVLNRGLLRLLNLQSGAIRLKINPDPGFHFDADPDPATPMRILYCCGVNSHGFVVSLHSLRGSVAGSNFSVPDPTLPLGCEPDPVRKMMRIWIINTAYFRSQTIWCYRFDSNLSMAPVFDNVGYCTWRRTPDFFANFYVRYLRIHDPQDEFWIFNPICIFNT